MTRTTICFDSLVYKSCVAWFVITGIALTIKSSDCEPVENPSLAVIVIVTTPVADGPTMFKYRAPADAGELSNVTPPVTGITLAFEEAYEREIAARLPSVVKDTLFNGIAMDVACDERLTTPGTTKMLTTNDTVVKAPLESVALNVTVIADAAVDDEVTVTVRPPAATEPAGEIVTLAVGNAVGLDDESTVSAKLPVPNVTLTGMVLDAMVYRSCVD